MISREVRRAIRRAVVDAGLADADPGLADADPGLRSTGTPGEYASSVGFALGGDPQVTAGRIAERVRGEPWVAAADVTGPGFLTITVTPEALAALPERIVTAGSACATSDALRGRTVQHPQDTDPLAATTWEGARQALAVQLTARLAAAAGATVTGHKERKLPSPHQDQPLVDGGAGVRSVHAEGEPTVATRRRETDGQESAVPAAVAYAGRDAVLFWLARAAPGQPIRLDRVEMARHVPENPAYAVRYAHARAASGVRWAVSRDTGTLSSGTQATAAVPRRPSANQGELALLDALSWLPERVATAARRRRPDEFARYLEELARAVLAALPGDDRLALAAAAQVGLAAGLGLLGVGAPDRL